jgi:hypothetical protein
MHFYILISHLNKMHQNLIHVKGYTFFITDETDEDGYVEILVLSLKRQPYPCVRIELDINPKKIEGYLQSVNYYTSCSIKEKELEKQSGTITMIQTALTYMLTKYPHIKMVNLQDETFIDIPTKPLITPRRLLKGQMGWYEEYLNAIPVLEVLKAKLKLLRKPETQAKLQALLPPESNDNKWWIPANIIPIAEKLQQGLFHYLIGTLWVISASTIRDYNIELDMEPVSSQKGGAYRKRIKNIFAKRPTKTLGRHRYMDELL